MRSPDLSRLCGADVKNVKTKLRKSLLLPAVVCLLNRNRSQILAYVVENLRKRWYTGEEHTKIYITIRSECNPQASKSGAFDPDIINKAEEDAGR